MNLYHITRATHLPSILERGLVPRVGERHNATLTLGEPVVWLSSKPTFEWLLQFHPDACFLTVQLEHSKRLAHWRTWMAGHAAEAEIEGGSQIIRGADVLADVDRDTAERFKAKGFSSTTEDFYIYRGTIQPRRIITVTPIEWTPGDDATAANLREHQAALADGEARQ